MIPRKCKRMNRKRSILLTSAEREGFEPSIAGLPLYSLSRRAPSADSATSPNKKCYISKMHGKDKGFDMVNQANFLSKYQNIKISPWQSAILSASGSRSFFALCISLLAFCPFSCQLPLFTPSSPFSEYCLPNIFRAGGR